MAQGDLMNMCELCNERERVWKVDCCDICRNDLILLSLEIKEKQKRERLEKEILEKGEESNG
jgi:hypothetical protein